MGNDTATAVRDLAEHAEKIKNDGPQRFPEAATPGDFVRQGDLYINLLPKMPADTEKVAVRLQLAEGETQGSRHCLDSDVGVTMYRLKEPTTYDGPILDLAEERTVTHPEHGDWVLPPGLYGITYQRTQDRDERERRVQD